MAIEYHGWIALASSQDDSDDGQIEDGFLQVEQLLDKLDGKEGHWAFLGDRTFFPVMVYLNGLDVNSIDTPKEIVRRIGYIFDKAYGELAVVDAPETRGGWTPTDVRRYVIVDGKLV